VKWLLVVLAFAILPPAPALAQRDKGGHAGKSNVSQEDRRRIREDVDSARGSYGRREAPRGERMAPEERDKLRRDVQDANKAMRRR
jgi:hypothetical protein